MSEERQETVADIMSEMRGYADSMEKHLIYDLSECSTDYLRVLADRIEDAVNRENRTVEESSAVGNAAATRNALESVRNWCINRLVNAPYQVTIEGLLSVVNTALSKPPRNCDVGTTEEQVERHHRWCGCNSINCCEVGCRKCIAAWEQMPYEEGGEE